jgi:hypothetical protein
MSVETVSIEIDNLKREYIKILQIREEASNQSGAVY